MESLNSSALLAVLLGAGVYWIVYSLLLLILMKLLGWRVGLLPLLGSTALATLLAQIPVVGPFVATGVLALLIWKASGSDLTDSVFSVVIASALMFAFQIFLLTALVGEIRGHWFSAAELEDDGDTTAMIEVPAANAWRGPRGGDEILLYLKGISLSSTQSLALVGSGNSFYSFTNGEIAIIRSPRGDLVAQCEGIDTNDAVMKVEFNRRTYRLNLVLPSTD